MARFRPASIALGVLVALGCNILILLGYSAYLATRGLDGAGSGRGTHALGGRESSGLGAAGRQEGGGHAPGAPPPPRAQSAVDPPPAASAPEESAHPTQPHGLRGEAGAAARAGAQQGASHTSSGSPGAAGGGGGGGLRISVVVPAMGADLDGVSPISGLLSSIARQTLLPFEVLVVMSSVGEDGCRRLGALMSETMPQQVRAVVNCSSTLLLQHEARNRGVELMSGDIVSFMDADDMMHTHKLEIASALFGQDQQLQVMTHTWAQQKSELGQGLDVRGAKRHYWEEMARLAQVEHRGQWVAKRMAHGAATVRVATACKVPWRCWIRENDRKCAAIAEDCTYIRDLLKALSHDAEFLYIFLPLIWYKPRVMKANGQDWGKP